MLHPKFKDTLPSNPLNAMSSIPSILQITNHLMTQIALRDTK